MSAAMPGHGAWTNTERRLLREAIEAGQSLYHTSTVVGRAAGACERMARELGLPVPVDLRAPGGQFAALTKTEEQLVLFMARRSPAIVPCADFAEAFGFEAAAGMPELVRAHVCNTRKKGIAIETRRGFGYWMSTDQARLTLDALGQDHTAAFMRGHIRGRMTG